jgi:hypothetical protein
LLIMFLRRYHLAVRIWTCTCQISRHETTVSTPLTEITYITISCFFQCLNITS